MNQPSRWTRIAYWTLVRLFVALRYIQHGVWLLHLKLDAPVELVHRPVRVLGARYMDALVNRKQ